MEMTGGEALVAQLVREGVTDVFGIPGVQLDWATDALRRAQDKIRYYVPRHEQTTSYMADGYARTTAEGRRVHGRPGPGRAQRKRRTGDGVCVQLARAVHRGPDPRARHRAHLWLSARDPRSIGRARRTDEVERSAKSVEEIPALVRAAMRELESGRPQPVAIEIPPEVLAARADVDADRSAAERRRAACSRTHAT